MIVSFNSSFKKDISKILDKDLKQRIHKVILSLQESTSLSQITNIKPLSGAKSAYRIKIGDYRMGFYYFGDTVLLMHFRHRKDIYKLFPPK